MNKKYYYRLSYTRGHISDIKVVTKIFDKEEEMADFLVSILKKRRMITVLIDKLFEYES